MEDYIPSAPHRIFGVASFPLDSFANTMPSLELDTIPAIEVIYEEKNGWDFFKDCDSGQMKDVVSFAENWAQYMQIHLSNGAAVEECWRISAYDARHDGTSLAMAHRAVPLLARFWVHGTALLEVYEKYQAENSVNKTAERELLEEHLY